MHKRFVQAYASCAHYGSVSCRSTYCQYHYITYCSLCPTKHNKPPRKPLTLAFFVIPLAKAINRRGSTLASQAFQQQSLETRRMFFFRNRESSHTIAKPFFLSDRAQQFKAQHILLQPLPFQHFYSCIIFFHCSKCKCVLLFHCTHAEYNTIELKSKGKMEVREWRLVIGIIILKKYLFMRVSPLQ